MTAAKRMWWLRPGGDLRLRLADQRGQLATLAAALVILAALPAITPVNILTIATGDLIFLQLAYSWNLVGGFLGELSLGHMIFWAIGAFSVIEAINHGLPVPAVVAVMLLAGAAAGAGVALAIRLARLDGLLYVAIFTLILGEVAANVAANWQPLGASVGIISLHPAGLGPDAEYEVILAMVAAAVAVNVWASLTRRGIRWRAIRDDAHAAATAGVKITRERVAAYAVSGSLCVLGGAFQGYYFGSGSAAVSLDVSTLIVASLAVFAGGPGTVLGPLAGVLVIYGLGSVVTSFSTSLNVSLYGQVAELAAALIALRFLVPRLGNRDLLTGTGWLLRTAAARIAGRLATGPAYGRRPRGSAETQPAGTLAAETRAAETQGQPAISIARVAALTSAGPAGAAGGGPLVIEGVRKGFGPVKVLRGVSFQVEPGQVVGLLGSNGAGKSTLCNILSGLIAPDDGAVSLGSADLVRLSVVDRSRHGVGRSFQTPRLFPGLSLRENLAVAEAIGHGRAGEILEALAITTASTQVARSSDFFARRLTEVARAVILGGQILLLDEPLAGLTEEQHAVVLGLARRAAEAGARVIVVEHLIPAVAPFVDKLVVLADGVVIADGPAEAVLADEAVIRAYLGSALVAES